MTWISNNTYLSTANQENNARIIYQFLSAQGWTINAVSGMLGNMEVESTINPGIWQNLDEGNTSLGFGLVQWTPSTKVINWIRSTYGENADITNGTYQLRRLLWEVENPGPSGADQWYPVPGEGFDLSFEDFSQSLNTPEWLAEAFLRCYESPNITPEKVQQRGELARKWYNYLLNVEPGTLGIPVWLLFKFPWKGWKKT